MLNENVITIDPRAVEMLTEPSFELFRHAGLLCCVRRMMYYGNLNGYVAVDNMHPFYEKSYSDKLVVGNLAEIKAKFPNVELKNAYDSIKGYRQEVYLEEIESDNYWSWLIAFGWLELSLTGQLMLMDKDQKKKLHNYINLAKIQYPQNFKSEAVS